MRRASNIRKFNGTSMADNKTVRPETIMVPFQTSDRKPVGLPFRIKSLWTFACFPLFKHINMSWRSWSVQVNDLQVGTSWTDVGRCLNFNMAGRCNSSGIAGGGYCVWPLYIKSDRKDSEHLHAFLYIKDRLEVRGRSYEKDAEDFYKRIYLTSFCFPYSPTEESTIPRQLLAGGPPFLSRKEWGECLLLIAHNSLLLEIRKNFL